MDRRFLRVRHLVALAVVATGLIAAGAMGSPPNLTGTWHAPHDSTPWHLTASSDLSSLSATWRGGPGHTHLRGSFSGTLNSDGNSYSGSMHVTEDTNHANGTMTFTINNANKVTITYSQDNGVAGTIVLVRAAAAPPPHWSYRGYANDVKVAKPLVGDFQLGTSHSNGSGTGGSGTVGTHFTPKNQAKYGGPYSFSASVTGYHLTTSAHGHTKRLVLDVTMGANNGPRCSAGDKGTLTLTDSSKKLSNGERADKAEFAWAGGRCPGFVQGWDNNDGGAKTSPHKGGPPNGGQWAIVSIG